MTAQRESTVDAAEVMGLRGRVAAGAAAVAWAAFLAIGLTSGEVDQPGLYLLGFVVLAAGVAPLLRSPGDPMTRTAALTVVACGVVVSLIAVVATVPGARTGLLPLCAAPAMLYAVLCVRGRPGIAWAGCAGSAAAVALGAVVSGSSPLEVVLTTQTGTVGVLIMATVFALLVRPRAVRIAALRRLSQRELAQETVQALREDKVALLESQARPLLDFIASGQRLNDEQVATCLLLEAGLRDRIRAPGLDVPALSEAAWEARARGVHVVLLDDRESPLWGGRSAALDKVRDAAVGALTGARAPAQVTVRLLPERRREFATIVVVEDGPVRRIDFPMPVPDGSRHADGASRDVCAGPLVGVDELRFETDDPDRLH